MLQSTFSLQPFNLEDDPLELRNLAADAVHADEVAELTPAVHSRWDIERFKRDVLRSQRNRHLVNHAS